jgi:hypothetical protein
VVASSQAARPVANELSLSGSPPVASEILAALSRLIGDPVPTSPVLTVEALLSGQKTRPHPLYD